MCGCDATKVQIVNVPSYIKNLKTRQIDDNFNYY
jgi:hypothetical protein